MGQGRGPLGEASGGGGVGGERLFRVWRSGGGLNDSPDAKRRVSGGGGLLTTARGGEGRMRLRFVNKEGRQPLSHHFYAARRALRAPPYFQTAGSCSLAHWATNRLLLLFGHYLSARCTHVEIRCLRSIRRDERREMAACQSAQPHPVRTRAAVKTYIYPPQAAPFHRVALSFPKPPPPHSRTFGNSPHPYLSEE
jgi:hypothetical protein